MKKICSNIFALTVLLFYGCNNPSKNEEGVQVEDVKLSLELAQQIYAMPTHCIEVEYPNKLGQVLGSGVDLKSPKSLRPVFYGCFDWHSSVHGYWSVIKLLKAFPELDKEGNMRKVLNSLAGMFGK